MLSARYEALRAYWRPPAACDGPCYEFAGIWDPEAEAFPNQHYALSHLVLAAQILGDLTGNAKYIRHRDEMMTLAERQYAGGFAVYDVNTIHWDFNNLALLMTAGMAREPSLTGMLNGAGFRSLNRENTTWAANWMAMRATDDALRSMLKVRRNRPRRTLDAFRMRKVFRSDGGIDEYANRSRPIQYHAYVLALMLCRGIIQGTMTDDVRTRILRGVNYLIHHIDSAGNANYRGRGQYQLFFEGPVRYVLEVLCAWSDKPQDAALYGDCLRRLDMQPWPVRDDGLLALVRTDPQGKRMGAHYDYHYLVVYNAFDLAWRALAVSHAQHVRGTDSPIGSPHVSNERYFEDSGMYIAHRGDWTLAIAAGEPTYLADTGVTLCHLGGRRGTCSRRPVVRTAAVTAADMAPIGFWKTSFRRLLFGITAPRYLISHPGG